MKFLSFVFLFVGCALRGSESEVAPVFSLEKAFTVLSDAVRADGVVLGVFTSKKGIDYSGAEFGDWIKDNPINPDSGVVLVVPLKVLKGRLDKYVYVKSYYSRFGMDNLSYKSFMGVESSRFLLVLRKNQEGNYYDLVGGVDQIVAVKDAVPVYPSILPTYSYLYSREQFDGLVLQLESLLSPALRAKVQSP